MSTSKQTPRETESSMLVLDTESRVGEQDHEMDETGFVRSWGRNIQAWFGLGNENFGQVQLDVLPSADSSDGIFDTQVDHFHVPFGEKVSGSVFANDLDADPLSASLAVGPANGTLSLNEDGSFEYVPDDGFFGLDRFWYEIDQEDGHREQVEVCVFIDAPLAFVPKAGFPG